MATSTPNLGLINPADGELFDVEVLRQNNNTVDEFAGQQLAADPFGHMGKTNGFQDINPAATVTMDAAQILRGGMTFDNATDSLVVPKTGKYRVAIRGYGSGGGAGSTYSFVARKNGVNLPGSNALIYQATATDYMSYMEGEYALTVGDKISVFGSASAAAGNAWGDDGYAGVYLEVEWKAS